MKKFKSHISLVVSGEYDSAGMTEPEAAKEAVEHILAEARSNVEYNGEQNGVLVTGIDALGDPNTDIENLYYLLAGTFRERLIKDIKKLILDIAPKGTGRDPLINIEDLYQIGDFDRICMYDTPKDEPDNYSLHEFGINKKHELYANADSIYDGGRNYFCQNAFTVADLHDIRDIMEAVKDGIDSGEYAIDDNGNVTVVDDINE